jgi:hypothetical protein
MCLVFFVFHTFRSIYLKEILGITGARYGTIAGGLSLMGMVGPILWTTLGDHSNRHKECLLLATILQTLFFSCISFLSKDTPNVALRTGFLLMSQMVCQYGMQPLLDTKIMVMLNGRYGEDGKAYYGRQILFGTIGYMVITRIVGYLYSFDRNWIFYLTGINTAVFICTALCWLPGQNALPEGTAGSTCDKSVVLDEKKKQTKTDVTVDSTVKQERVEQKQTETICSKYLRLFGDPTYVFFLFVTFCNGFSRGVSSHFLPVFTKSDIVGSDDWVVFQAWMGMAMEVVLFSFTKQMVDLMGVHWMLIVAQLTMAVRMTFYALIPLHKPVYIYPAMAVELLKGMSYACMQVPGVHIARESAPAGLEATALGVYLAIYVGLSPSVAGLVGGFCSEYYSQLVFQVSGVVSWLALGVIFTHFYFNTQQIRLFKQA